MAQPKTTPAFYKRKLSPEGEDDRLRLEHQLAQLEARYENERSVVKRLQIEKQAQRVEQMLLWQGADPRKLPLKELKEVIQQPLREDTITDTYRKRIKNPATGIRAYCIGECMCGQTALVRDCLSLTCPLWPFRMGNDPLRGYDIPKADDIVLDDEDDEDAAMFSDDEDDDEDAVD